MKNYQEPEEEIKTETSQPMPKDAPNEQSAEAASETADQEPQKKRYRGMTSTKNGLTVRALIGAFLLYYAYSIASDITSTSAGQRAPLYAFIAIFAIVGIWVIADSIKRLIKKEYDH